MLHKTGAPWSIRPGRSSPAKIHTSSASGLWRSGWQQQRRSKRWHYQAGDCLISKWRPSQQLREFHKTTIKPRDKTLEKATQRALLTVWASLQATQRSHRLKKTAAFALNAQRQHRNPLADLIFARCQHFLSSHIALVFCFANLTAILQCHVLFSKTIGCPAVFEMAKVVIAGLYSILGRLFMGHAYLGMINFARCRTL